MTGVIITKVLLSAFAIMYVAVFFKSICMGEIFFVQGRGLLIEENRKSFRRFILYHGVIAGVFVTISITSWFV
jgi:hypothetical protein